MWTKLLGALLGAPAEQIAAYLTKKMELKQQLKLTKQQGKIDKQKAVDAWEMSRPQDQGWKDEFVLLVISIPMVMAFFPGLDTYVQAGFDNLSQTPDWYRYMIIAIYLAIFGIRWRRRL